MKDPSTSLSEELGKPVEDIQSTYIRDKIESLEDPRIMQLKRLKELVRVERCLLGETDESLDDIIEDEKERRVAEMLVGQGLDGFPFIDEEYKESLKDIDTDRLPKDTEDIQSSIVAKGIIENGIYSQKSEILIKVEQQILGEEDYKGAGMHGRAYPRMLAYGDLDYSDHYKIFLELKPEVFRENNFIKHYLREEQLWKGTG